MKRRTLLLLASLLPTFALADEANPVVEIKTNHGLITVELFQKESPASVENFLKYVDKKFYDGTVFHRVMSTFMIQGGGFAKKDDGKHEQKEVAAPVKNEAGNGLTNDRGTLAMARTANPDSATAQFFINVVDNKGLNRPSPDGFGYAVFGKVTNGMDVVDAIKNVAVTEKVLIARLPDGSTRQAAMQNVPETDVVIESITLKKADAAKPAPAPAPATAPVEPNPGTPEPKPAGK